MASYLGYLAGQFLVALLFAAVLSRVVRWLFWRGARPSSRIFWPNFATCLVLPIRLGIWAVQDGKPQWGTLAACYGFAFMVLLWWDARKMRRSERALQSDPEARAVARRKTPVNVGRNDPVGE